jgi:hypothetical protein
MTTMIEIEELLGSAECGPSPEELAVAPKIDGWWLELIGGWLRARGDLSGHPDISDPHVTTSPVIGFDVDAGWLRTRSRFYRLGRPLDLGGMRMPGAVPADVAQRLLTDIRAGLRGEVP